MAHIYPECPNCGEKASDSDGVNLRELPDFVYRCDDCEHKTRGHFEPLFSEVFWTGDPEPYALTDRLRQHLPF